MIEEQICNGTYLIFNEADPVLNGALSPYRGESKAFLKGAVD